MKIPKDISAVKTCAKKCMEGLRQSVVTKTEKYGKYIGVAAIFAVAVWYNLVVAPTDSLERDKFVEFTDIEKEVARADLDENDTRVVYEDQMNTLPGEWYRLGIRGEARDADETLEILSRSEMGRELKIATLELERGAEVFREYIFQTDGVYRDVIVRKEGERMEDRWGGGEVVVSQVFVSRLNVETAAQAQSLRPTLERRAKTERIPVGLEIVNEEDVFLPSDARFIEWGVFQAQGDRLLTVTMSARKSIAETNETYRVELRAYDEDTQVVDKKPITSFSFSEAEAQRAVEGDGILRFDMPEMLEVGNWYVLGVRQETPKNQGGLEFAPITFEDGSVGWVAAEIQPAFENEEFNQLLAGARIEDVGPYLHFEYAVSGGVSDFLNIYEASETTEYDVSDQMVRAEADVGEYFTYKIDTIEPFYEMFISARQDDDYEDQIAMEYSYDNDEWKEIPYEQNDGDPQRFALRIEPNMDTQVVYVRVRYGKEENSEREFGLERFRVTARMAK